MNHNNAVVKLWDVYVRMRFFWMHPILFYLATLCASAVFAVARCPSVCSSVCLSVTFVHSIQTAEDIIKLLSRSGSTIILVFLTPAPTPNSKGNPPLQRGRKIQGVGNFAIFDWNRRISRKRYEIGLWLLRNVNRKSYALYWMVTLSMTLTDPNPVFNVTAFLKSNISKTVLGTKLL